HVRRVGIFDPRAIAGLLRRARAGKISGFAENQAFVAALSTHLWHDAFFAASVSSPVTTLQPARIPAA
ncbi:MAG: hypothetical protein ACREPM_04820, partial [Gemmatimonadaceae bacterium]